MAKIQHRGHRADQNATGANTDDRRAGGEKITHVIQRIGEMGISPRDAPFAAMYRRTKGGSDAMRHRLARARQRHNNRCQSHGSAPFVSRIIEK